MELALRRGGGEIALGRELGAWGEVRAGVLRDGGTVSVLTGDPAAVPDGVFDTGDVFARLFIDELDSVTFPRSGHLLRLRAAAGLEALGSDDVYERIEAEGAFVFTGGRVTALLRGWASTTPGDDAPFQRLVRLGGFTRLSGLERDELAGQHAGLLSCALFARIGDLGIVPVYAGCSMEYGEVFRRSEDIRIEDGRIAGSALRRLGARRRGPGERLSVPRPVSRPAERRSLGPTVEGRAAHRVPRGFVLFRRCRDMI